ncbi:hypothetical protein GCM10010466_09070 [Planomonospora alba]|uniref:TrbL/VirB6 plasmid conjugal transfer protein n=1 Tax=Planomonospora alba TaxID=161354 RepID=A0ABP6MNA9_9ACTN
MTSATLISDLLSAPTPSPSPEPTSSGDSGLGLDVGDWIGSQINDWFAALVALAIRPLLDMLATSLLATPGIDAHGRVADLWRATMVMANGAFVLFVVAGGVLVMGHETVQTRHALKEILPRLVLAFLTANASLLLTSKAIEISNALAQAVLGQGFDARRAANAIRFLILQPGDTEIFYILLALVAVVLLVLLLITFMLRVALTTLLVVAAPLALCCHALPQTDGLARLWWRVFSGLLLIQLCQSLTLVTAVRVFFNQDGQEAVGLRFTGQLYNLLLALTLLIVLVRIPGWVSRAMFLPAGRGLGMVRIVKYALAYKLTNPLLNVLHLRKGSGRGSGTAKRAVAGALAGKALPALAAGPAGTAAAGVATAATAASAARGGAGPVKHAPVAARRPIRAGDWEPGPVKHAPSAPPVQGKYRTPPRPQKPVPPSTPVYGYPRENFYAAGPAGLNQMHRLRAQGTSSPLPPRRAIEPPPIPGRPVRPIVPPNAPIPGSADWPENPARRRTPPPPPPAQGSARRRTRKRKGGGGR